WNGNRERWTNLLTRDPDRSVVAWAWTMHAKYRDRYERASRDPACAHLRFVTVRDAADASSLLTSAQSATSEGSDC
ncbi:MAG: hypothetical protein ACTHK4_12075, partial [Mycobacteriales bacterium]